VQFFGTLPPKICTALGLGNATAPAAGANVTAGAGAGAGSGNVSVTATATPTPTGSSPPAAFMGAAAVNGVATGLFAVVAAGLVGLML